MQGSYSNANISIKLCGSRLQTILYKERDSLVLLMFIYCIHRLSMVVQCHDMMVLMMMMK